MTVFPSLAPAVPGKPELLPVSEAAIRYGLPHKFLKNLLESGTIASHGVYRNEELITVEQVEALAVQAAILDKKGYPSPELIAELRDQFAHLENLDPISLTEASKIYRDEHGKPLISLRLLSYLVQKKHLKATRDAYRVRISQADAAIVAELYRRFGTHGRSPFRAVSGRSGRNQDRLISIYND